MFVPDSGQQTILYYNPENPHMIYVPAENQTSVSTILKIIGIAFVICGICWILLQLLSYDN